MVEPSFRFDPSRDLNLSKSLPTLQEFKLQLSEPLRKVIPDELVQSLINKNETELCLDKLPITDEDLKILLSYCPKLTALSLSLQNAYH
jgi:hypothetical protein